MKEKIINISSGRGPVECQLAVTKTLATFLKEAKQKEIIVEILNKTKGEKEKLLVSVSLSLKGHMIDDFISSWEGSLKWICESPYRKNIKRKNWFIDIKSYDTSDKYSIDESEIVFKTTKSSGPGGQHVNKTESAIRAIHYKSGISILVQDSRSQHQNKKIAIQRLKNIISEQEINKSKQTQKSHWKSSIDIERGNPKRIYIGKKFKLKA